MTHRKLSREELFVLVWERPMSEIAVELGISDVAVGKLCQKLQVPKPPRGYWARVEAGQKPRRPALNAFRDDLEERRRSTQQARTAGYFTDLQSRFLEAALKELRVDTGRNENRAKHLSQLNQDVAAQVLLLIQGQAQKWAETGKVSAQWSPSVRTRVAKMVERIMPLARPQLLVFETEGRRHSLHANGPIILVRWTHELQKRIATLADIVRRQNLGHVVQPLSAMDHAWSGHHIYTPEASFILDSWLCISSDMAWVEWNRRSWRDENPPERLSTSRILLRDVMPIEFLDSNDTTVPTAISEATIKPYKPRLDALAEAERIHEMITNAAYAMDRSVPNDVLAMADRIWFGEKRPFQAAREAFLQIEEDLEQWEQQLEAERSNLARSILGVQPGDTIAWQRNGQLVRISAESVSLYAGETQVTFVVSGKRFRKDGTLGKLNETMTFSFENEGKT